MDYTRLRPVALNFKTTAIFCIINLKTNRKRQGKFQFHWSDLGNHRNGNDASEKFSSETFEISITKNRLKSIRENNWGTQKCRQMVLWYKNATAFGVPCWWNFIIMFFDETSSFVKKLWVFALCRYPLAWCSNELDLCHWFLLGKT